MPEGSSVPVEGRLVVIVDDNVTTSTWEEPSFINGRLKCHQDLGKLCARVVWKYNHLPAPHPRLALSHFLPLIRAREARYHWLILRSMSQWC